ncbi:MAG: KpsF/GutQ family sugar-phosphate isomerase [Rhizobiales bacterium TMED83]|jgi:arabinose-5-phosphate isomerase|nr:KpsF/GutQ family sugar-phosphate isomerase [Rhodobiaceae bacterium]RPF92357.1 MAG: KpsF/GutQ family sugar-phosphate isomerase [Rhizobiales bacterium TMED83]
MTKSALQSAQRTLATEIEGLQSLSAALGDSFEHAVSVLAEISGRVIVSGMGKSGHVGAKIAATLASTGTPAQFVHPGEASHGDLGMITPADAVLTLSWSGETAELANLIDYAKRFSIPLIALTSGPDSMLGRQADICIALPKTTEACPNGLAPTTSTTMQLALGDALAVALLEERKFTPSDFKNFHPGGKLGAGLVVVQDVMHTAAALPLAPVGTRMDEALIVMTEKGFGCLGVQGSDDRLAGIISDGDLRRHMSGDLLSQNVEDIMTATPVTISADLVSGEALQIMNDRNIQCLFVCENERPVGLVRILDLLKIGVA